MTHQRRLAELHEELARQDETMAQLAALAESIGDASVVVEPSFLDAVEALATQATACTQPVIGIRA